MLARYVRVHSLLRVSCSVNVTPGKRKVSSAQSVRFHPRDSIRAAHQTMPTLLVPLHRYTDLANT